MKARIRNNKKTVILLTVIALAIFISAFLLIRTKNENDSVDEQTDTSNQGHNVSTGTSSWDEEKTQEMIKKSLENNSNLSEPNLSEEASLDDGNVPE